ncbi:hypothetical protein AX17_006814 [Amanita inopinata Kibby_2008]|nr:hypothetical protein AX17_006814 [Amanita inopinata Kibby_2008]
MAIKADMPQQATSMPAARGYQQEMLEESLRRNIIIALDTGSGKTHIALLRMKLEAEREPKKVSWFLAPTVTLCEQQKSVIGDSLNVPVGHISGSMEPTQWKSPAMWRKVLDTHPIMVTTPQVLLDALRHGYVYLGRDINLIVFDEVHHAVSNHPYNRIMQEFYFRLPSREQQASTKSETADVRPMIMGLTASPIYGGDAVKAFRVIECNLDSAIRAPRLHRAELAQFVHRPVFKHVMYTTHQVGFSINLGLLVNVTSRLNIEDDPYVKSLRTKLKQAISDSPDCSRLERKLSSAINKKNTFVHKGLTELFQSAEFLLRNIGTWTADWYIYSVIKHAKIAANPYNNMISTWKTAEKKYLFEVLDKINPLPISYCEEDILDELSDKVTTLIETLLREKADAEAHGESYSGIVFVERRDAVLALTEILTHHPLIKGVFRIGCLLGQSSNSRRHSFLDITRHIRKESQQDTLRDFRLGEKNLIISTAVAEEGIDIQACGSVIRWDPPNNMASWAQSRGRARRQRSTYTLMFAKGSVEQANVAKWEQLEQVMVRLYNDPSRVSPTADEYDEDVYDGECEFRVESTGALLTLHSAISHLHHFCSVIPSTSHVDTRPLFELDPLEPLGGLDGFDYANQVAHAPGGPLYGSKVTLPRCLPLPVREYSVDCIYRSKISAHRHAAFEAYCALYEAGLLNDNLLPITSFIEPKLDDDVKAMLADVEKRSSTEKVSLQMNPWSLDEDVEEDTEGMWWCSILTIEDIFSFYFFTRREPVEWEDGQEPVLYRPGKEPIKVYLSSPEQVSEMDEQVELARDYTRRFFWCFNGSRMEWDHLDFSYLLLPCDDDSVWEERREDALSSDEHMRVVLEDEVSVRADVFGRMFSYPDDISVVKRGLHNGKSYAFVRWRTEPLTEEEEEELYNSYSYKDDDLEITYPLLVVRPLPPRTNFLIPVKKAADTDDAPRDVKYVHLLPEMTRIPLLSPTELECAFLMPSILRDVSMTLTVSSLSQSLFTGTTLAEIPIRLLINAMAAPAAGERCNYQRLESLGDTVLKFLTTLQLLAQYPLWHEGYLARKKDHTVSNNRLAKGNISKQLYRWIIRDRLISKKWKPVYDSTVLVEKPRAQQEEGDKKAAKTQQLSTKVLADVVESLIGAAYIHGGLDFGYECIKFFGFGMTWEPINCRIDSLLSRVEVLENVPLQLASVERMIGYTFKNKLLLIEALTHASYESDLPTSSYERMEFLGDSVLDMVVTKYLYHAPANYSPGHIHLRRSAVVNAHFLAYICLRTSCQVESVMYQPTSRSESNGGGEDSDSDSHRNKNSTIAATVESQEIYLGKCLLHSSPRILEDQRDTYDRLSIRRREIEESLCKGKLFPWASLTRLQSPKFFSDIVESIIGAVYLDCRGDLSPDGAVQSVMRKLGILDVLEWIVRDNVDIFHPVSRVAQWADKRGKEVEYKFEKEKGLVSCVVLLDGEEVKVRRDQIPVLSAVASSLAFGNGMKSHEMADGTNATNGSDGGGGDDLVPLKVVDKDHSKATQDEVKFAAAEAAIQAFNLRDEYINYEIMKKRKSPPRKKKGKKNSDVQGNGTAQVQNGSALVA